MRSLLQIVSELEAKRSVIRRELTRLDAAISALRGASVVNRYQPAGNNHSKPRRTMSITARKRIAAAQRARWAAWKARQKKAA